MFLSIILFLFIFTLIALAHEGGHFVAAKRAGIKVNEFGIGFGPKIWSKEINGTTYSISLIPILAYVSVAGMDEVKGIDDALIPEDQKYFAKPPFQRFKMAFMGPSMNILLAFITLSLVFGFIGVPRCFFSSRRRHTRLVSDWSSDVCSSDLRSHFLKAEDGIRDWSVTGVQTCAL